MFTCEHGSSCNKIFSQMYFDFHNNVNSERNNIPCIYLHDFQVFHNNIDVPLPIIKIRKFCSN